MNSDPTVSRQRPTAAAPIAPELLLSLVAAPFLVGLVAQKVIGAAVQKLGLMSEEVLRGDRLPSLNFPQAPEPEPTSADHTPE